MRKNDLSLMIGGHAGQGVKTVGEVFARMCSRAGLWVFVNQEYPSNIKGEHLHMFVQVSEKRVRSQVSMANIVLCLDGKSVIVHQDDLTPGGALIYDGKDLEFSTIDATLKDKVEVKRRDLLVLDVPLQEIAKEVEGSKKMINSVGLGIIQGLLRFDFDLLEAMLREYFSKLEDDVLDTNVKAAKKAYEIASEQYADKFDFSMEKVNGPKRMLLTGNEAMGMGAIKAGCKFYVGYPMTPSSGLLSFMAKHAREFDIVVKLPEDEIAASGMALGAAYAGVRAMTGTSGGGYCLMSEHVGLAGMLEIPMVIMEGQRPGPATGLPTRTGQGDLKFVLNAHQDEFPRIVVAPGCVEEAFRLTFEAFNMAEATHSPVIILSDKHLCECSWTHEPFKTGGMKIDRGDLLTAKQLEKMKEYKPHAVTESGVSPRSRPGLKGGLYRLTSDEHDEHGVIEEDPNNRKTQVEKRLRKIKRIDVSKGYKLHGDPDASVTLVSWGSTKPVILDTMEILEKERGMHCNFLQIIYLSPFPVEPVTEILSKARRIIDIENNATAQLADVVREQTGIACHDKILKYSGRQFHKDELFDMIVQSVHA